MSAVPPKATLANYGRGRNKTVMSENGMAWSCISVNLPREPLLLQGRQMNLIAILHLPAFVAGRWEDGRTIPDS
jgi:hypothetical protein